MGSRNIALSICVPLFQASFHEFIQSPLQKSFLFDMISQADRDCTKKHSLFLLQQKQVNTKHQGTFHLKLEY